MGLKVKFLKEEHKGKTYQFPARGNQAEDYKLKVNGVEMGSDKVRTTGGGGKAYTYFKLKEHEGTNQSVWVPGAIPSGTEVTIETVEDAAPAAPKPPKAAAAAPAAAAPAAPAKPAAQRPAAKPKK